MSDQEIRTAVVKKASPDLSLDGKSDSYVEARFDLAIENAKNQNDSAKKSRSDILEAGGRRSNEGVVDSEKAREKMIKDTEERWKKTPGEKTA